MLKLLAPDCGGGAINLATGGALFLNTIFHVVPRTVKARIRCALDCVDVGFIAGFSL